MHDLDLYDKKLLKLLQQNNKLTTQQLGREVNLSQSAVQRRISKLRKKKVIEADVSIISPQAIGIGIVCVVDVILHEGNSIEIERFKKTIQKCDEVSQCYYVTGTYDFVLTVNTRDMSHFEEFQKKYLTDNANLKHFYTHVVMERVKVNYGPTMQ